MIVTLIVLIYLAYKSYRGYQTGFTKLVVNLVFSAIVLMGAIFLQNPIGNWLYTVISGHNIDTTLSPSTNLMLYRFLAFFIVFFIGKKLVKIIRGWVPTNREHASSFGRILDGTLGAIVSFFASYFAVYIVLSMFAALQNQWFTQQVLDSSLLRFIIYDTPGLSNGIFNSIFSLSRTAA